MEARPGFNGMVPFGDTWKVSQICVTVVDNQSPPIISAIIDLLLLLPELMRTS